MNYITRALPIWGKNCVNELNCRLQFRLTGIKCKAPTLYIATSGVYQLFVDGKFLHCGPARAGRGHFRVDVIDLSAHWRHGRKTVIALDVAGYNTETYYIPKQTPFLQAELVGEDGTVASWTGDGRWEIIKTPGYIQRAGRYSFQRPFLEAYRLTADHSAFKSGKPEVFPRIEAITLPGGELMGRTAPYPQYEVLTARGYGGGVFTVHPPEQYREHHPDGSPDYSVFSPEDMDFCAMHAAQDLHFTAVSGAHDKHLEAGEYRMFRLPHNASGFLRLRLTCTEPTVMSCLFDEILTDDGQILFYRMWTVNHLRWELQPGTYDLLTFEPYTMRYINLAVLSGSVNLSVVQMVEYKHPPIDADLSTVADDSALQCIAEAAVESFRQNAVDVFTDCPSRERAGWLCDSFFIARTAYLLTGSVAQETAFLENFLHEEHYENLPAGMFPMCYPADHPDGNFIPNWSLWLILQLNDYLRRGGDQELVDRYHDRVYDLLRFFTAHENRDGLLEDLPGWVFVDWSGAADWTQNVNYPTNMLYGAALRAAGLLYNDGLLIEKGNRVLTAVELQSYDGKFFCDRAVRRDGRLFRTDDRSEACQAYAFFFGIATPQKYPHLYKILRNELGPRRPEGACSSVIPAGPFVGQYMRLDVLRQNGEHERLRNDVKKMLLPMAERTGTLWEKMDIYCSCCHGFASYVLCWLLPPRTDTSDEDLSQSEAPTLSQFERELLQSLRTLPAVQQQKLCEILRICRSEDIADNILQFLHTPPKNEQ